MAARAQDPHGGSRSLPPARRAITYLLVASVLLAAFVADGLSLFGGGGGAGRPGQIAPPLPREVLVPPREDVTSLRGRPAAIDFWASWCDPCRQEAPELERLAHELDGRATLVGVNVQDEREAALKFIAEYGWTFPNLRAASGSLGAGYPIVGLPTTFIVGSDGRIARVLRGPQTAADIAAALPLSQPRGG